MTIPHKFYSKVHSLDIQQLALNMGLLFFGFGALVLSYWIFFSFSRSGPAFSNLPRSIHWAGRRKEIFSRTRACIREFASGLQTLKDGYATFNRHGQPFAILDPSGRPSVMLPKEHIRWLIEQPEDVLADHAVTRERLALKYLTPKMDPTHIESMIRTVKSELGRNFENTQATLFNKLQESIDSTMGLDESSWRQVCLFQIMNTVIFRSSNSILVGSPLCHNEKYLLSVGSFSTWLGVSAVIIGQYVPWFTAPLFGSFASVVVYMYRRRCLKFLLPVVKERMEKIKRKRSDPLFIYDETKDLMTWLIIALPNASPAQVADQILFLTLAAIHSTILSATNVFLDLLTSPPHLSYYKLLRAEASTAFPTASSWLDSTSITKLSHTDSTIRESLRQNPTIARVAMRQVVHKNGITIPSGQHLPQGAWLGCSALGVQNDERFYLEPERYDPFRFSKAREEMAATRESDAGNGGEKIGEKKLDGGLLVTTSETFLSFGHGRRACPGRFFVANQLKMLVAYITLNYDMKPIPGYRPSNFAFGDSNVPNMRVEVSLRRRKAV